MPAGRLWDNNQGVSRYISWTSLQCEGHAVMAFKTTRLDRFIHRSSDFSIADTRLLIAQKRIMSWMDCLPNQSSSA